MHIRHANVSSERNHHFGAQAILKIWYNSLRPQLSPFTWSHVACFPSGIPAAAFVAPKPKLQQQHQSTEAQRGKNFQPCAAHLQPHLLPGEALSQQKSLPASRVTKRWALAAVWICLCPGDRYQHRQPLRSAPSLCSASVQQSPWTRCSFRAGAVLKTWCRVQEQVGTSWVLLGRHSRWGKTTGVMEASVPHAASAVAQTPPPEPGPTPQHPIK